MGKYDFFKLHFLAAADPRSLEHPLDPKLCSEAYRACTDAGCSILCVQIGESEDSRFQTKEAAAEVLENALASVDCSVPDSNPAIAVITPAPSASFAGDFDGVYDSFANLANAAEDSGAAFIVLSESESLFDAKAALIAVKENSTLPVAALIRWENENGVSAASAACLSTAGADLIGFRANRPWKELSSALRECRRFTPTPLFLFLEDTTDFSVAELNEMILEFGLAFICVSDAATARRLYKHLREPCLDSEPGGGLCCITTGTKVASLADYCLVGIPAPCPEGTDPMGWAVSEAERLQCEGIDAFMLSAETLGLENPEQVSETVQMLQRKLDMPLVIQTDDLILAEAAMWAYTGRPGFFYFCRDVAELQPYLDLAIRFGATFFCSTCEQNDFSGPNQLSLRKRHYTTGMFVDIWRFNVQHRICDAVIGSTLLPNSPPGSFQEVLTALKKDYLRLNVTTFCNIANALDWDPSMRDVDLVFLTRAMDAGCRTFFAQTGIGDIRKAIEYYQKALLL